MASAKIINAKPITNNGMRHNKANASNQIENGIPRHEPICTGGIKNESPLKRLKNMVQQDISEKMTPAPKINSKT
jgi:hypothetical protein